MTFTTERGPIGLTYLTDLLESTIKFHQLPLLLIDVAKGSRCTFCFLDGVKRNFHQFKLYTRLKKIKLPIG